MLFEHTKTAVTEYKKELKKLKSELRARFLSHLEQDLYELRREFPNLDKIFIVGSTPEWNDGEDCVHESSVYIENVPDERYDEISEYVERIYWDEEKVPEEFLHINTALTNEEVLKIYKILHDSKFEDSLQVVFDTNFHVIIDLTEETIKVTVTDYDRGY